MAKNGLGSTPNGRSTPGMGVRRQANMKEINTQGTTPAGASQQSRVFGIEQLGKILSMEIAQRMHLHYDELCRKDGLSKVRTVRSEDGRIDVLGTFLKVRKTYSAAGRV